MNYFINFINSSELALRYFILSSCFFYSFFNLYNFFQKNKDLEKNFQDLNEK